MAEHTPGPWETDEFRTGDWRVKAPQGDDGCWWVAEVSGIPGTERANASLIAAAPELLAACKGLLECAVDERNAGQLGLREEWMAAQAAIAKAEGK